MVIIKSTESELSQKLKESEGKGSVSGTEGGKVEELLILLPST